jgi:hypothetical protein
MRYAKNKVTQNKSVSSEKLYGIHRNGAKWSIKLYTILPNEPLNLISYNPTKASRFNGKVDIPCKGYKAEAINIHVENK